MVEVWPGAEEVYARMCVAVCASWLGRDGHCMEQITQFGMGCGGADSDASVKHHLFIFDQLLSKTGQEEEKWLLSNFCCSLSLSRAPFETHHLLLLHRLPLPLPVLLRHG